MINDDYYQIFIDNLQGKEKLDIFKMITNQMETLGKEFLNETKFLDNKIYTILNYIKFKIVYEAQDFNNKNCTNIIAEKILRNKTIKQYIIENIEKQGQSIIGIINEVFTSDVLNVNDVDFFEVIYSKLNNYFCLYLLNIIYYILKQNLLIPILFNENLDLLLKTEYFRTLINSEFNKTSFEFSPKIKMSINYNKIVINNGLGVPQSQIYFNKIITYVNEEKNIKRYISNEDLLRKNYEDENTISEAIENYKNNLDRMENNIKVEMNKYDFFKNIYIQNNKEISNLLLNDYLKYFIIRYLEKNEVNCKNNDDIFKFLLIIVKIKISPANNYNYIFENSIEELVKIILFTEGYKNDINQLLDIFLEIKKYCINAEINMKKLFDENIIKYDISDVNKKHRIFVNITFFKIIESLSRILLLHSLDLIKNDKNKFYEYFHSFKSIEANLQKFNKKYYLYSREIYNIRSIIKIEESYKYNHEQFENNYEKIMNNLLQQSIYLYDNNYNNLYDFILNLNKIFDETFTDKNDEYINLLFFIFRQQYNTIFNEEIKIKLIEDFFKNPLLILKCKLFLSETLKNMKPEIYKEQKNNKITEENLINNFMNFNENKKLLKYNNLINIYNNIESKEFNELLLFTFETQCQSYFNSILNNNKNKYTKKCCTELLLKISLEYLKKAIKYLYEHTNNNDNNLLKLYAIAYLKSFCYFYVEINYNHFDKCNFDKINEVFNDESQNNKLIRNMRNIYIWRLYFKKFENFEQFQDFNFETKNVTIFNELLNKLVAEKEGNKSKYIFKESFITKECFENYKKISPIFQFIKIDNNINLDLSEIVQDFDTFYCSLVNKIVSYLYGNNKNLIYEKMTNIYKLTHDKINFENEGKILYRYLMNQELLENNILKKISNTPLKQEEFEILLYSFRFILNIQLNPNKCFYKDILKNNANQFINNNYIPGSFPLTNNFIKSYYDLEIKFQKREELGYYICKDCGFLYQVLPCTYPTIERIDPNGHVIGGRDHYLSKKDIRVFPDINELNKYNNGYSSSYVAKTLEQYKIEYVDQYISKKEKGIMKDYRLNDFESKNSARGLNLITYRFLNYILYSFLMGSYILNNLNDKEIENYLLASFF